MPTRVLTAPEGYDLNASLSVLALGRHDPAVHLGADEAWWASHTPAGPATLRLHRHAGTLRASGFGPGAEWIVARAPEIAGLHSGLDGLAEAVRAHTGLARLVRRFAGVRLPRTGRPFAHLVPTILGQKVTGIEAARSYTALVRRLGRPAPGPNPRLLLPPAPTTLAATPYWALHPLGVERRRAETIRRAAAHAGTIESAPDLATATARLVALPGIGAWTAAEVVRVTFGDPDVLTTGDYNLPHLVCWALTGQPRGDDARMLELLAPFAGYRGWLVRLLELAGHRAPRFGPRAPLRSFANF